jgi:DNA-binding transcriptional LysR family regulator
VPSPDYLARHGTPSRIEDLEGHRAVGLRSITTGLVRPLEFVSGAQARTVSLPCTLSVTGTESYLAGLRLGLGLAQLPRFHIEDDLRRGALVPVLTEFAPPPGPVSLLYARTRQLAPRVRVFLDWAAREFAARTAPPPH